MEKGESIVERRRRTLLCDLDVASLRGMELGPLDRPLIRRCDGPVLYVDHADQIELRKKYENDANIDTFAIVDVDAVWGSRTLASVVGNDSMDYIIASHVMEHVPDLVGWLREVEVVLRAQGQLIVVLPDKRLSFDCRRRTTTLVDVLDAFVRKARAPQPYQILDGALNVVRADAYKLHTGEAQPDDFEHVHAAALALASAQSAYDYNIYVDIHCWTFTPRSFARLMHDLVAIDLIRFSCTWSQDTSLDSNFEFYVKMEVSRSKNSAVESWQRMELQSPYEPGYLRRKDPQRD